MADYIADRDDWDVATLALSVNMVSAGFTVERFRERVVHMVETVGETGRPVVCITLFPLAHDISDAVRYPDAQAEPRAFRAALREAVDAVPHSNVHLLEGTDLLSEVGERLGDELANLL